MDSLGDTLRKLREERELSLRAVADVITIDQAILSKIERQLRKPTRQQVVKLANYFKVDENELLVAWLSEKLLYEIENQDIGLKALQMAEEKAAYRLFLRIDRKEIIRKIKNGIKKFPAVEKAYIYGSFARQDDGPKSDIDVALKTDADFNYFDLAEIGHQLENAIQRKIDVGFLNSFKPHILKNVQPDLTLIYER